MEEVCWRMVPGAIVELVQEVIEQIPPIVSPVMTTLNFMIGYT